MILLYFVRFLFLITSTAFLLLGVNLAADKSEQVFTVLIVGFVFTILAIAI
jgi:hypothetical protein